MTNHALAIFQLMQDLRETVVVNAFAEQAGGELGIKFLSFETGLGPATFNYLSLAIAGFLHAVPITQLEFNLCLKHITIIISNVQIYED